MEEIISYIMETPENVNGNILREKLQEFKGEGGSGGDDSALVSLIDGSITEIRNDSVTSIKDNAFYRCSALTTVDFPNVTSIGNLAFSGCSALTAVDLPNVTSITVAPFSGNGVFAGISSNAVINLGAAEGEIPGAPWGAPEGVTINYNVRPTNE